MFRAALYAVAMFFVPALPALAACDNTDYSAKLDTYYADGCLPADSDVRKRVLAQRKTLLTDLISSEDYIPRSLNALLRLKSEVESHATQNEASRSQLNQIVGTLETAHTKLGTVPSVETITASPAQFAELLPSFWNVDATPRNEEAGGIPAIMLRDSECSSKTPPDTDCDAAFRRIVAVADDVYVASNLILDLHSGQRARFILDSRLRADRWNAYLYDTQFQFLWELVWNRNQEFKCPKGSSARLAKLVDKTCHAQSKDSLGNQLGFREVPDYRAILLHPDIAVGYFDKEAEGQHFKPVLVVQWFGFQWWDWEKDRPSSLRAVSLVSSTADTTATSHTGIGLQFQYGGFSLALTKHRGGLAVMLNTGLVNQLGKVNQNMANKFKAALEQ